MNQTSILIKNAEYLVTMDSQRRLLRNTSLLMEGKTIKEIATETEDADTIIDARGKIVLPGFINCHHHLFQSLFRNVPKLQNQPLDHWLAFMHRLSENLDEEAVYYAALTNLTELVLSGCTTAADFFYLETDKKERLIKSTLKAAQDIGIRFHQYQNSLKLIEKFHDDQELSMTRIGLGVCTPFTEGEADYVEMAKAARKYNLNLQTHLAESRFELEYLRKNYNLSPLDYMESVGWVGEDVSLTHCVFISENEIAELSKTKTSVVHCPISNARGSGIAPVTEMLKARVNIGLGVDGSAGNDSSNLLEEMRWARTLQGAREGFTYLKPLTVLEMVTLGGARVLRRDDLGRLEVGKAADVVIFDPRQEIAHAGATADPVGSLVASQAIPAETVIINGKIVVREGNLLTVDTKEVIEKQNKISKRILNLKKGKHKISRS